MIYLHQSVRNSQRMHVICLHWTKSQFCTQEKPNQLLISEPCFQLYGINILTNRPHVGPQFYSGETRFEPRTGYLLL